MCIQFSSQLRTVHSLHPALCSCMWQGAKHGKIYSICTFLKKYDAIFKLKTIRIKPASPHARGYCMTHILVFLESSWLYNTVQCVGWAYLHIIPPPHYLYHTTAANRILTQQRPFLEREKKSWLNSQSNPDALANSYYSIILYSSVYTVQSQNWC